jgi:hypothetical protein
MISGHLGCLVASLGKVQDSSFWGGGFTIYFSIVSVDL